MNLKICLCLLTLCFVQSLCVSFGQETNEMYDTSAEAVEDLAIVRIISSSIKENYEKINTWQGDMNFTDTTHYFGAAAAKSYADSKRLGTFAAIDKLTKSRGGSVSFAVDVNQNKLFARIKCDAPMQYSVPGEQPFSKDSEVLWHESYVVCQENYLHFRPLLNYGRSNTLVSDEARGRMAFRDPYESSENKHLSNVIDPRETFKYGVPIWETLDSTAGVLSQGIVGFDGYRLTVEEDPKDGTIVVKRPSKVGTHYLYKSMVFDPKKNYNIVSLEMLNANDNNLLQKRTWDYDCVDGIWIPNRMTHQIYNSDLNELKFERSYFFKTSKLNEPVPDDTFSWKNLGLVDGDRFLDNIQGVEYTYRNGSLVAAGNRKIIDEASGKVLEAMLQYPLVISESSPDISGTDKDYSERIFIPEAKKALNNAKPYILDLNQGKLVDWKDDLDSPASYRYFLTNDIYGLAYKNDKLLVLKEDAYSFKQSLSFGEQFSTIFEKGYASCELSDDASFPTELFVKSNSRGLYSLQILTKEKDGLWVQTKEIIKDQHLYKPGLLMEYFYKFNISDQPSQQDEIVSMLLEHGREAIPVLVQSLLSKRKNINTLAAEALGRFTDVGPDAIKALATAFQQGGNHEAGITLGRLKAESKNAVPILISVVENSKEHSNNEKVLIAIQSLGKIGPYAEQSVPALKNMLDTSDPKIKIMVIGSLAKIGYKKSININNLKQMAENKLYERYLWYINRELNELKQYDVPN